MTEIVWLLDETIIAIHHRQIAEHGGTEGLEMKDYFRLRSRGLRIFLHMATRHLTWRL